MSNENNGRWWEFYLIRYLLGTIVGAIIVNVLVNKLLLNPEYVKSFQYLFFYKIRTLSDWQFIFVHLAVGFVFCYIASTPILVFHSIRLNFKSKFRIDLKKKVIYFIILILSFIFLCLSECYNMKSNEKTALFWFFLILFIQIFLMVYHINKKIIFDYTLLTSKRDWLINQKRRSYVESYKHLREHGNAFFILFLEIILGTILYQIVHLNAIIILITLWIMPGAAIWFFGNYLEKKLYQN